MAAGAARLPRVAIEYCVGCKWMMRAAWMAQELLTTFEADISEVALQPDHSKAGVFRVWLTFVPTGGAQPDPPETQLVWDRAAENGFPELKVLKQRLRDVLTPGKSLGHSEKHHPAAGNAAS
eukprot:TRINITY_DN11288_c0_g1_i1.p3 TRINITY_DN11288_c0_g1~~TRINITY_DN11288_c0_g1_i1.p3  ORF type:complete len:122 (-),score=25.12 TRINITY_DN11288_c0_g1_i1:16-381(-)